MTDAQKIAVCENIIEELFEALTKPKGWRLKLLKWLFPELTEVADLIRKEYYWKGVAK